MAEQLALEQRLDDRGAVDGDEAAIAARTGAMQRARDQLLAGAGLAGDQRGAHVRRQPADQREQILHQRPAADHAAELQPLGQVALHRQHAAPALDLVAHGREHLLQPREVERLAQVVHRAELDRLDRGVDRGVAGHQHRLAVRVRVADRPQHLEAADVRHAQIDHHQIGVRRLHLGDPLAAARAGDDLEPGPRRILPTTSRIPGSSSMTIRTGFCCPSYVLLGHRCLYRRVERLERERRRQARRRAPGRTVRSPDRPAPSRSGSSAAGAARRPRAASATRRDRSPASRGRRSRAAGPAAR